MKKSVICFLCLLGVIGLSICHVRLAQAAVEDSDFEVDVAFIYSQDQGDSLFTKDTGGINIGAGYMLNEPKSLQARIDLSSLKWNSPFMNLSYERRVVALSGRYYVPTFSGSTKFFAQLGVEASLDKKDSYDYSLSTKSTKKETNIGALPGAGLEIGLGPSLGLDLGVRYHAVTDSYLDAMIGLAFHF